MPCKVSNSRRHLLKLAGALTVAATLPMRETAAAVPARKGLLVRKLSWAGVLIETANTALFIDAIGVDEKKGEKPEVLATSRQANAAITHHHGDHFDKVLLRKLLGDDGRLVCVRAALDWMDQRNLRVQPVDMWQ